MAQSKSRTFSRQHQVGIQVLLIESSTLIVIFPILHNLQPSLCSVICSLSYAPRFVTFLAPKVSWYMHTLKQPSLCSNRWDLSSYHPLMNQSISNTHIQFPRYMQLSYISNHQTQQDLTDLPLLLPCNLDCLIKYQHVSQVYNNVHNSRGEIYMIGHQSVILRMNLNSQYTNIDAKGIRKAHNTTQLERGHLLRRSIS